MSEQEGETPSQPIPHRAGSYMHFLPTYLPEGMHVTGTTAGMLPWLTPSYSGFVGTTTDGGDPAMAVTFEAPTIWLRTTDPLGKFDREWLHLRRYSADQALATGTHAFADIRPGADPPDAVATTDKGA